MTDTITRSDSDVGTISQVDLDQMLNPFREDSDDVGADHHAHYLSLRDNPEIEARFGVMGAQELISTARFHRLEVTAMCGYKWVPELNPSSYPVCGSCVNIAEARVMSGSPNG